MSLNDEKIRLTKILKHLEQHSGWHVYRVLDGEDKIPVDTVEEAIEHASAVEEATIRVHDTSGDNVASIMVVWGNGPEDIICDYTLAPGLMQALEHAEEAADRHD